MRHERIPIEQKLRGDKCEPCEPAYGVGLNESHAPERVSMNAASTSVSALRNGSGNEMEWLMGEGMDDPLSSLLHMEQEAQGGTGDFGTLGDDLFGMPAPSGIFADNAGGSRGGVPVKRDDPPPVTVGDSNLERRLRHERVHRCPLTVQHRKQQSAAAPRPSRECGDGDDADATFRDKRVATGAATEVPSETSGATPRAQEDSVRVSQDARG